jgi:hypothetical protein
MHTGTHTGNNTRPSEEGQKVSEHAAQCSIKRTPPLLRASSHARAHLCVLHICLRVGEGQNKKGRSERTQTQKRLKKEERTHKTGRQGDRETGRQEDSRRDRQSTATHKARRRRKRKKKEAWSLTGTQQICWLRRTLSGCRIVSMCCDISSSANTPCVFQEGDEGVRVCGWGEGE